jgi:hypothetical protein
MAATSTRDHEQQHLGARGVDADMARDGLVVADDAQRKAKPRAADQPARQEDQRGEAQQHPVDLGLGEIGEHVEALLPGHCSAPRS